MPYIYKYVNNETGEVEYVGIITSDTNFPNRFYQHQSDDWYKANTYSIYFSWQNTISDVQALEGHFIALYHSDNFFNKAKTKWGLLSFVPEIDWTKWDGCYEKNDFEEFARRLGLDQKSDKLTQRVVERLYELQEKANSEERRRQKVEERLEAIEKRLAKENLEEAMGEYRVSVVKNYIDANTVKCPGYKIIRGDLYKNFNKYCTTLNITERIGKEKFYKTLRELNFPESRDGRGAYFWGIKLKEEIQ